MKSEDDDVVPPPSDSGPVETEPELEIDESEPENDNESLPSVPADNPLSNGIPLAVQLSDPPSRFRAGAYQRISEHGDSSRPSSRPSSRHDSSLKSSTSLPITTEVLRSTADEPVPSQAQPQPSSTQATGDQNTSLVVPDSQSQQHFHETSSFKVFSPVPELETAVSTQDPATSQVQPTQAAEPEPEPEETQEGEAQSRNFPLAVVEPVRGDSVSQEVAPQPRSPIADEAGASGENFATKEAEEVQAPGEPQEAVSKPEQPAAYETSASDENPATRIAGEVQAPNGSQEPVSKPDQPLADKTNTSDESPAIRSDSEQELAVTASHVQASDQSVAAGHDITTTDEPTRQTVEEQSEGGAADEDLHITSVVEEQPTIQASGASLEEEQPRSQQRQDPPQTQSGAPSTSEQSRDYIVISSENEHGQNSSNDRSNDSAQFLSQAKFSPPPGGQRPPSSSALQGSVEDNSQPVELPPGTAPASQSETNGHSQQATATQSSFPFATQLPKPSSAPKTESKAPGSATKRRAIFAPFPKRTASRPPSVTLGTSVDTSSFPPIPSQPLQTLGESAPPKLPTPTPSISNTSPERMDPSAASQPATPSLSSQLKAIRESRRQTRRSQTPATVINNAQPISSLPPSMNAEVAAARMASPGLSAPDSGRSPSAVPAVEPESPVIREEMNTSERYETLLPQAQSNGLDYQEPQTRPLTNSNEVTMAAPEDPNEDPEVANMHLVPIPFNGPQRDSYSNNIYHHNAAIERILAERHPAELLLEEAEKLLQRLRDLATHPDLTNHETLSQASEPDRQAQWDVDSSGKFCFLQKLFDALQELSQTTHVAVAARGHRVPDMLETFCSGWFYTYSRSGQDHPSSQPGKDKVRITILDLDKETEMPQDADIVISMDGTTDYRHRIIRAARRHTKGKGMTGTNSWAMLLTLVVPKTVEHIERCLASDLPRAVRARVLLATARKLQHEACRKEHDGQDYAKEAARKLVEYLDDPEATEWPLGSLSPIQDLDSQTQTELEVSHADVSTDHDSNGHPSKRPRLSGDEIQQLPTTINPQDMEITHVSDSLGSKTTQPSLNAIFATPTGPSVREQQLEAELDRVQGRLEDHVRDLEKVQYRNEEQRADLSHKSRERDGAVSRVRNAIERMNVAENNNSTLKAERTELQKQLDAANAKLLDHSVPERVDFERLRLEAEAAHVAKAKADKSVEKAQNEMEWFRSMYQDSSNKARELQAENNDLQARLAIAEKQASGEMARAQQISQDMHWKTLDRENRQLRSRLKDREAGIKFRDEEITRLKESTRGRMGTRQSSVPRSPRLGSPMKLAGGRGSRQASPAAGEVRGKGGHPLRNSAGG